MDEIRIKGEQVAGLQDRLLVWFPYNRRDFPWRYTDNPYVILVAEKLLQQTAARDAVVKAFREVVERYPSVNALADAEPEALERILAPLGFHFRARDLKAMSKFMLQHHGGSVPADLEELKLLPGVGEYIARAVLSFAYGQDVAVVDTNVARFMYRVFGIPGSLPSNPARKKSLLALAQQLVPHGQSKEFNLAVLDLCALICKPTKPECASCPVQAQSRRIRSALSRLAWAH